MQSAGPSLQSTEKRAEESQRPGELSSKQIWSTVRGTGDEHMTGVTEGTFGETEKGEKVRVKRRGETTNANNTERRSN